MYELDVLQIQNSFSIDFVKQISSVPICRFQTSTTNQKNVKIGTLKAVNNKGHIHIL